MTFKSKYLKYKKKYLELKQYGGIYKNDSYGEHKKFLLFLKSFVSIIKNKIDLIIESLNPDSDNLLIGEYTFIKNELEYIYLIIPDNIYMGITDIKVYSRPIVYFIIFIYPYIKKFLIIDDSAFDINIFILIYENLFKDEYPHDKLKFNNLLEIVNYYIKNLNGENYTYLGRIFINKVDLFYLKISDSTFIKIDYIEQKELIEKKISNEKKIHLHRLLIDNFDIMTADIYKQLFFYKTEYSNYRACYRQNICTNDKNFTQKGMGGSCVPDIKTYTYVGTPDYKDIIINNINKEISELIEENTIIQGKLDEFKHIISFIYTNDISERDRSKISHFPYYLDKVDITNYINVELTRISSISVIYTQEKRLEEERLEEKRLEEERLKEERLKEERLEEKRLEEERLKEERLEEERTLNEEKLKNIIKLLNSLELPMALDESLIYDELNMCFICVTIDNTRLPSLINCNIINKRINTYFNKDTCNYYKKIKIVNIYNNDINKFVTDLKDVLTYYKLNISNEDFENIMIKELKFTKNKG